MFHEDDGELSTTSIARMMLGIFSWGMHERKTSNNISYALPSSTWIQRREEAQQCCRKRTEL